MIVKDVVLKTSQFFKEKGLSSPRLDAEILIASGLGWPRIQIYTKFDYPLSEQELKDCRELVRRRSTGEPIAYILGQKDFYKLTFGVESGVLIPRPETELLVERVLELVADPKNGLHFADLGCGSGCIGLSLLHDLVSSTCEFVDLSAKAIEVSKRNSTKLNLDARATFFQKDVVEYLSLGTKFDLIVANPPYIDPSDNEVEGMVRKFEPHEALYSEDQGLFHLKSWGKAALSNLNPGGFLIFEIGHLQGPSMKSYFELLDSVESVRILKDLSARDRFVEVFKRN